MHEVRRVLLLAHRLPYPPDRGDRIRSYHLVKHLSQHFDLDVACVSEEPVWLQHHQLLATMAKRVAIQPITPRFSQVSGMAAWVRGRAITPAWHYRQSLVQQILQWQEQIPFDAVLTFCTGMVLYARQVLAAAGHAGGNGSAQGANGSKTNGAPPVRHILDLVDVDSLKWQSYAESSRVPMRWIYNSEARRLREIESGRGDAFDAVTVVSELEAEAYRQHVGPHPHLTVVPNGVDLEYFHPMSDAGESMRIVFVGVLNYRPNAEGVTWFVREVMPLLRAKAPEAKFQIVGRNPTPDVVALGREPGVEVVGSVPDVRVYLRSAAAVVAPLLLARGVQNKVLEAMACQRACVCSPGAAGGINATDGTHYLVADAPARWVDHLVLLLNDSNRRRQIAQAARTYVQDHFAWESALAPMVRLLRGEPA